MNQLSARFAPPLFRMLLGGTAAQRDIFSMADHNKQARTDELLAAYMRPHIVASELWLRMRRFFHWQLDCELNLETLAWFPLRIVLIEFFQYLHAVKLLLGSFLADNVEIIDFTKSFSVFLLVF